MAHQVRRYCNEGHRPTLHAKQQMSNGTGCVLSIITVGLFIPFWLLYGLLVLPFRPFRCQGCGKGRLT